MLPTKWRSFRKRFRVYWVRRKLWRRRLSLSGDIRKVSRCCQQTMCFRLRRWKNRCRRVEGNSNRCSSSKNEAWNDFKSKSSNNKRRLKTSRLVLHLHSNTSILLTLWPFYLLCNRSAFQPVSFQSFLLDNALDFTSMYYRTTCSKIYTRSLAINDIFFSLGC